MGVAKCKGEGTHSDQHSKNGQNNMGETEGCKLFMSGGLCSNRISISVINFITLFQCLTDMVNQID